eukprot:TRINITY_DN21115_c0_g1_i1.p1 TRINITY_DN21115_c0_g1~~TRINITY_DN21115_c0_g1_i1.p1  ORF type:complete len:507 (+),score=116.77 TRINITY_DN21115_c0_g1_i1:980-2500(+)
MGCFGFSQKRKVSNRSPETSAAVAVQGRRAKGRVTALPPASLVVELGPLPPPTSPTHSGPLASPSPAKESNYGGRPQVLPTPPLPSVGFKAGQGQGQGLVRAQSEKAPGSPAPALGNRAQADGARASMNRDLQQPSLRVFSVQEIKVMTDDFSEDGFLGEGGFGEVFQGLTVDGLAVAVKVLNKLGNQGEGEWLTEITFLNQCCHPNLVNLIGYCSEGEVRSLVYEFLPNGSLEFFLFAEARERGKAPLSWSRRLRIAVGAARGLAYLHEEAASQVIYRDFKTSNILLDSNFETKLSDFGLAREGPEADKSHVTTRVVGTAGYAAPEYVMTGHLTTKSDVYSFGIVLLELLTGRLAMDRNRPAEEQCLLEWADPFLKNPSKLHRMMDRELSGRYSVKGAKVAAAVALSCVAKKAKERPRMSEVVSLLLPVLDFHDMAGFTMSEPPKKKRDASPLSTGSSQPASSSVTIEMRSDSENSGKGAGATGADHSAQRLSSPTGSSSSGRSN